MRKRLTVLVALMMFVVLGAGTAGVGAHVAAASQRAGAYVWEDVHGSGLFTVEDNVVSSAKNSKFLSNFYLTSTPDTTGDYEVSAKIKGTLTTMSGAGEVGLGLVPWYIDENNYILIYYKWTADSAVMTSIEYIAKLDGKNAYFWADGFTAQEWNTQWMDAPERIAQRNKMPSDTIDFKITKSQSPAKDTDIFAVYMAGIKMCEIGYRDTVRFAASQAKAGVYAAGDAVTFTDFTINDISANTNTFSYIEGTAVPAKSAGTQNAWTAAQNTYTVDASGEGFDSVAVLPNPHAAVNYQIEADITTASATGKLGLIGYYLDEYRHLSGVVEDDGEGLKAKIVGITTDYATAEKKTKQILAEVDLKLAMSDVKKMQIKKVGGKLELFVNGASAVAYTVKEFNFTTGKSVGLIANGLEASFGGVTVSEVSYVPYDWFTQKHGSITYNASLKDMSALTFESESAFTIAVDGQSKTPAAMYTQSLYYDVVNTQAAFAVTDAEALYGIIAWAESGDKYLSAFVTKAAVGFVLRIENTLTADVEPVQFALPDFTAVGSHTVAASVSFDKLTVTVDGAVITEGYTVLGQTGSEPGAGVLALGADAQVSGFKIDGYTPYQTIKLDKDWTASGMRANSWTMDGDKNISYNTVAGFGFLSGRALMSYTEQRDFYIASKIEMQKLNGTEWKVGMFPYYKDMDNYCIVWLGKWSDGNSTITMSCKLNGRVVGNEWRETPFSFSVAVGAVNTMELRVNGDVVSVYLNGGFNAAAVNTFEGLNLRSMESASVGLNGFSIDAKFAETKVSDSRIVIDTNKPTISRVSGTVPETSVVGASISIPIFVAEKPGEIVTPVITVTGPDGSIVTPAGNKFAPDKTGVYKIEVTCTDLWGNTADPLTYQITVTEPTKTGCGKGSAGIFKLGGGAGIGGLMILGLSALLLLTKTKKPQKRAKSANA